MIDILAMMVAGAATVAAPATAVADATAFEVPAAMVAQGQGQGQGQGNRGGGQGEARGNRGQGQGQGNRAGGQDEARGNAGQAQGQGQGQGNRARGQAEGRGNPGQAKGAAKEDRRAPRLGRAEVRARVNALPPGLRRLADSDRRNERMVVGAIARASARGVDPADALVVRNEAGRVRVLNRDDELLLDLDEQHARELGAWRMRRLGDRRPTENAPAFCRSGEGHPVWGREWCIDKDFGLGSRDGSIWSRSRVDDIVFRADDRLELDRGGLLDVLGDIVIGRLALHSLAIGHTEPLNGMWVREPDAPVILRVHAGDQPVAELVDLDRDGTVEVLYVTQARW